MAEPKKKAEKVAPYHRLLSFDSPEAMDRFDEVTRAIMERHEEHRFRCEVRHLLRLRDKVGDWDQIVEYFAIVSRRRGEVLGKALAASVKEQWRRGNRGAVNDWRDS